MLHSIRNNIFRVFAAIIVFPVLFGCDQKLQEPLKFALHTWSGYEPLFMAEREGWLDKTQVRLIESHTAADSIAALKSGAVDGAGLTLDKDTFLPALGSPYSRTTPTRLKT